MRQKKSVKSNQSEIQAIGPQVEDYDQLDPRSHVYIRPDSYIGNIDKFPRDFLVYNQETKKMVLKNIDLSPAIERLFLEILSNAADNCGKSKKAGVDCKWIEVKMDCKSITVKNYGLPIPLEKKPGTDKYIPEMIFGSMFSGSNLKADVQRHGIGMNGIGSKATNIFSVRFEVIIESHIMKQKYYQLWENNMLVCHKPVLTPYKGEGSSVQISYELEFKKFGYKQYPDEAFDLFRRHAIDTSFTSKVPIKFNDEEYNLCDYQDYALLYFDQNAIDKAIIHQQYNEKDELELELYVFDTPDEGTHISFANCMLTFEGGVHNDAVFKAIGTPIIKMINDKALKLNTKTNDKDKKIPLVTINDLKQHVSILLSVKVIDPGFKGQCKEYLTKPAPKVEIDNSVLKSIYDWNLIDRLQAAIDAKQYQTLVKTDGKMCKFIELEKGKDSTWAGTNKRGECILLLSEGKSASSYLKHYISNKPQGPYIYGNLPLKGKCLNTMKATDKRIAENKEIIILKKMLGLQEDVDYTDPVNFRKLRYGKVILTADADPDGAHIVGLVLNIFYSRFPSLLKISGFLQYKRTPIIKAYKGKTTKKFYTQREYDMWINKTGGTGYKIKYFKGLATSTPKDVIDDIEDERLVTVENDEDIDKSMTLAFHRDKRDERKHWILNWIERTDVDSMVNQPISLFINHEFIRFSKMNLKRSIPKIFDGYKESQRKIICGAHKYFNIGPINKQYDEERLGILDGYIISKLKYHHGDGILSDAIVKMAQNFVGTNNINVFEPEGQFGTRMDGGQSAGASRYLNTFPSKIFPYIFHIDDQPLLKYMEDENKLIEPEYYHQVVPLVLINGCRGMATGYSTYIPCHNPLDVINWLRLRLKGSTNLPTLIPYYRDWEGNITIIDRRTTAKKQIYDPKIPKELLEDLDTETILDNDESNFDDSDDEALCAKNFKERPLLSFISTGNYHITNKGNIIITELPIGLCPDDYNKFKLIPMQKDKKIKSFEDNCTVDKIHFVIKGFVGNPSYKNLFLRKRYGLTNMILLDNDNKPIRYETANDIIETFYNNRIIIYGERKKYKLEYLQHHINKLNIQIKFINAINDKTLNVNDTIENIYLKLEQLQIPKEIYEQAKIKSLNKGETTTLQNTINNYKKEYDDLLKITPSDIWLTDLKQLETAYKKIYKQ